MAPLALNYQGLLGLPSSTAFTKAIQQAIGVDLTYWESYYGVTLGTPEDNPSSDDPHATWVPVVYTNPCQDPDDEPLSYTRLNLGEYLDCCLRYLTADDIASSTTLCAWLLAKHGLYFDPADLTLGTITADPDRSDRQTIVATVAAGNYVWYGTVTLYVVASHHLALYAYPGTAKGLQWSDVLAP